MPVVIVQSLLAAYATWKLAVTVKRYKADSKLLALASVGFQFGVTFLCRFVAIRGSSYIDSIMTEGLGLSLYVLFVVQLYEYIMEEKTRNLVGTAGMAVLLVNLRKQMMITLCLMAAVVILYYLIKKRKLKKLLLLLVMTACLLGVTKFTDRLYNYAVRGVWIEHSGNSMGMLCTLIYTSGEEDAALFEDEVLKGLYQEIYTKADEQGLRMAYAPVGWEDLSSHYADSYDAIGYGIINPVVQGYIAEHYDYREDEELRLLSGYEEDKAQLFYERYAEVAPVLQYDEYCNAMVKVLLGQEKETLLKYMRQIRGKALSIPLPG